MPLSPDFPSVTKVIAGLYPQSGGRPGDGAVAIDPVAMAALLRLTGPITVSSWPEPITAENAERILLYEPYLRFATDERADFLAVTTARLWERLSSVDLGGARKIVDALGAAVEGKHLLVSAVDRPRTRRWGGQGSTAASGRFGATRWRW